MNWKKPPKLEYRMVASAATAATATAQRQWWWTTIAMNEYNELCTPNAHNRFSTAVARGRKRENEARSAVTQADTQKCHMFTCSPPLRQLRLIGTFSLCFVFLAANRKLAAQWLRDDTHTKNQTRDQNKATDININTHTHMKSTMWRFAFVLITYISTDTLVGKSEREREWVSNF